MEFPIFNSKVLSDGNKYNLADPVERKRYFEVKLGNKIDDVKNYMDNGGGFIGYLLAKKQAGKGTYAKMIEEILGPERFAHISVGDVVRKYHKILENPDTKSEVYGILKQHYRGYVSLDDSITALLSRTQDKVSVPSEMMLTLLKLEIDSVNKPGLFIDGLPRTTDQISYSLFFRQLIDYKDSPDFFVLIDTANEIIDARMKNRVVCPLCATSKNLLFNPSKFIQYDSEINDFALLCDNTNCLGNGKQRLEAKEGDLAGSSSISERLNQDQRLMEMALLLHGIPKILLRGSIPVCDAKNYLEDYEIQASYGFSQIENRIVTSLKPWRFNDDYGVESYTMYAATFVVNLFTQMHSILV